MLRRLAASSAALITGAALLGAPMSRRPHYGGTLRVETGASFAKLDADSVVAPMTVEKSEARREINALIYESSGDDGATTGAQGSGPFRISDWQPGKMLTLTANDKFSGGRPYLDGIEIAMARAAKDRLLDLELGKVDFAPIAPQDARHATERGVRVSESKPDELVALIFVVRSRERTTAALREGISASIDRAAIANFILQKTGEPAGGLLPQWLSGTEFLFAPPATPAEGTARAKELFAQIAGIPKLVLGYDAADPLAQAIAERIVLNAKDAGATITALALPAGTANRASSLGQVDAVIARMRIGSTDPAAALDSILTQAATMTDVPTPSLGTSSTAQDELDRERAVLKTYRIVPLEWVPQVYGLSARVRNWTAPKPGETWPFADVWLDTATGNTAAPNGQP